MKPIEQHLLEMLSNKNVTFFVPPYQRNYEWTESQCEVFFDDIVKVTELNLSGTQAEHFFGTIVYVQDEHIFGEPDVLVLTDGQQRITTTMLCLAAIRDSIEDDKAKAIIDSTYLKNEKVNSDTEYKIKLKQVETDWEAYKNIILYNDISEDNKKSAVWQNYSYFINRIKNEMVIKNYDLTKLIELGLDKFSLVTIQLEPKKNFWENPQEVFESMNSLGKPLSLADLVRNYILLGKDADEQEDLYHRYWLSIEKTLANVLSDYIRDYMQLKQKEAYKKATEKNYKELYSRFKEIFKGIDAQKLLDELKKYSKYYAQIALGESTGNSVVDSKLTDLRSLDVTTTYSFFMAIMDEWNKNNLTDKEVGDILEVFIIYFLRRKMLRLTQGENKAFPKLIKKIPLLISNNDKKLTMFEILANQENALRFPNDIEVRQQMQTMNFYNFSHCKFILSLIEENITKFRPVKTDKFLQIEHIMPRTLNDDWKAMLGEDNERVHQEYVNTIGNLTLIRHNQELGNKSFDEKKRVYINNAGLQIAKTKIVDCSKWTEEEIIRRRNWIVDYILDEIIPLPEDMKTKNNYANKESRLYSLSEHGLIGKYITYINDKSITVKVVGDREVEFEGKKWKLSPLVRELETRRGTVNSSGAYSGPTYWEYKGVNITEYYDNEEQN